jgi:type VI secretion system protein VasD
MHVIPVITAVAVSLSLCACGAWQSVSDTSTSAYQAVFHKRVKILNVDLNGRASLNPDEANRPVSVAVRIYQLKDRKSFDGASYDDLLKNERAVLSADLQDTAGVVVNPGSAASVSQPLRADTEYIAIVGFFRSPKNDRDWRRVVPTKSLSASSPLRFDLIGEELVAANETPREQPAR